MPTTTTTNEQRQRRMERLLTRAPISVPFDATHEDRPVDARPRAASTTARPAPTHRFKAYLLATALLAMVAAVQVWVVSAGRMTHWPTYGTYCCMLADGFLSGQTNLPITPRPELLALPDPYDPDANLHYRVHDAILFGGKYYLYWGPVPSLFVVAYKAVTLNRYAMVGDQSLVFGFTLGAAVLSAAIVVRLREKLFPEQPWWTIVFGVLMSGLVPPVLFLLARASVYEVAIIGGQFFLLAALYAALLAFTPRRPRGASSIALLISGVFCGAALGCRVSLLLAVGALALLIAWRLRALGRATPGIRSGTMSRFAAFSLPVALALALLGYYNFVRFGSFTEFGVQYQLAGINSRAIAKEIFSPTRYLLPNLWRYGFESGDWRHAFPFVKASGHLAVQQRFFLPRHYILEPVAGLSWSATFLWFAVVPVIGLFVGAMRWMHLVGRGSFRTAHTAPEASVELKTPIEGWVVVTLVCVAVLGIAPALVIFASTMRYLVDGVPCLVLLATIGLWQLLRASRDRRWLRRGVITLASAATVTTVGFSILLAVTGYYGHFGTHNPELYRVLTAWSI